MRHKPKVRGEIRSAPRAPCRIPAIIVDQGVSISCVVEDLSITGCRVRLAGQHRLAARFRFEFPRRAITVDAELVWMQGDEVGIRFLHKTAGKERAAGTAVVPPADMCDERVEIG